LLYTSGLGKKKAWYSVRSALRHRFLEKEQTGIKPFSVNHVNDKNTVYDLSGRRVNTENLRPGVYIKAGKKISIN
jgi:hypothetical protein